ncbi:hypothetical protein [Chryseobacterium bernardetii]
MNEVALFYGTLIIKVTNTESFHFICSIHLSYIPFTTGMTGVEPATG